MHTPTAAFMTRWLARKSPCGSVLYTVHGFHFYHGAPIRNWLFYYGAERIAVPWTDGLIVINREDFDNACRMGYQPGKNLFHVHGVGVPLEEFGPSDVVDPSIMEELGIQKDTIVVTCIAELNDNKNQAFLLDAWKKLATTNPKLIYC